jgi:hypothetical protein
MPVMPINAQITVTAAARGRNDIAALRLAADAEQVLCHLAMPRRYLDECAA